MWSKSNIYADSAKLYQHTKWSALIQVIFPKALVIKKKHDRIVTRFVVNKNIHVSLYAHKISSLVPLH